MYSFEGDNIDEIYVQALRYILRAGAKTEPRGFICAELSPCFITLYNPRNNILVNPVRKASKAFMAAELLWILMGRNDTDMISFYNSKIANFSDDGKIFFGAYGPKVTSQLQYVIDVLVKDPWTRQAVLNIWRESPPLTKDVPCTVAMHFIRRPVDTLNLVVYMRSQDIWLGFPYDVHNFTCIQNIVAGIIGCKIGTFTLVQGSLHMYEQDFDKAKEAMGCSGSDAVSEVTPVSNIATPYTFKAELDRVRVFEENMRSAKPSSEYYPVPFCHLLDQKLKWLQNYARKKHETRNH